MKSSLSNIFKNKQIKKRFRDKSLTVFFICLGIATISWLSVSLTERYSSRIYINLVYENMPENKTLSNNLPDELELSLTTTGQKLLWYRARSQFKPLRIDVGSYIILTEPEDRGIITSQALKAIILSQLSSKVEIQNIKPDRIQFEFDLLTTRKVPIRVDADISFENQYNLSGDITTVPDSVTLKATAAVLDEISIIETEKIRLTNLSELVTKSFGFKEYDNIISISPEKIEVSIPVEKFTEAELEIKVKILQSTVIYDIRLYPQNVKIIYLVALSRYNDITPDMFEVVADFIDFDVIGNESIAATVTKFPLFTRNIRITPSKLEYIIQK
ncbi:MAG: YbbR-like domain-containing protein [Bacteroidetes bacterium]|nr:YbbR-like domain-containing protein [Bacteroidota bacterium]